jgi:hypothetical protein
LSNLINFRLKNAVGSQLKVNGYEVTILIDICSAIIDANLAGDFETGENINER